MSVNDLEKRVKRGDSVYTKIYNAIISGYYKSGHRLVERDIAESLQVSRTPVREALKQLEQEKLVTMIPYKGVFVSRLSLKEAKNVYQVRSNLEGLAARLATAHVTRQVLFQLENLIESNKEAVAKNERFTMASKNTEFHIIIARSSENELLVEMLNSLWARVNILRLASWAFYHERPQETLLEHIAIYEAMCDGDDLRAEKAMITHIDNARRVVLKLLAEEERGFE